MLVFVCRAGKRDLNVELAALHISKSEKTLVNDRETEIWR